MCAMRNIKKPISLILCGIMLFSLASCKGNSESEGTEEETVDTFYSASSSVSYSSGSDSNWSYGNQRKEFPQNETCYVRIGSTVITEKSKGVDTEITVTYKFTGAENCNIELSDGIATTVDSGDPNVVIYTRTIAAAKKNKAEESLVIFQYVPNENASSITLEVTYDDHVPTQYDVRNTIYFSEKVTN